MANSDWNEVKPGELPKHIGEAFDTMKAAYREYADAKRGFESLMQQAFGDKLAEGQELKFGYLFGKLKVAVGEKRERKAVKPKTSLSDWLTAQTGSGRAA